MICFRPPVLKPICRAASEESGLAALDDPEKKWRSEYPLSVRSWRNNWNDLPALFGYCPLIRKAIYTTNAAENFHRQLRKVTKTKGAFLSGGALMKRIYLTTMRVSEKWTQLIPSWALILGDLVIYCRGQNAAATLGLNPQS